MSDPSHRMRPESSGIGAGSLFPMISGAAILLVGTYLTRRAMVAL